MSLKSLILGTAAALLTAHAAQASTIVLTFEGVGDQADVDNFYNGGTDGFGNSGPNYGVHFASGSLGVVSTADGGSGRFSGNPSGDTILFFLSGPGDIMDVAAGFTTGFSFYYSAEQEGSVQVYSGLNGTGTLLTSLNLAVNWENHCAPGGTFYCSWDAIGVSFNGTAKSAIFSGDANHIGFDNITLGSAVAGGGGVPEPATITIIGAALAGLGLTRRRAA